MRAAEYVEEFPRELPYYEADLSYPWTLHDQQPQALGWSYRFGKLLHDQLQGREEGSDVFTSEAEDQLYRNWNHGGVLQRLDIFETPEGETEARNTANFHAMNSSFLGIWQRLMPYFRSRTDQPTVNRPWMLRLAQQALAVEATSYIMGREEYITQHGGTHGLFEQHALSDGRLVSQGKLTETVASATGIIQEFDVAISSLEALLRYPKLLGSETVLLPAPIQFAKTNRATNANLVLYNPADEGHAIGLQAKMGVTKEDLLTADKDRVVFIDGKVDMQSVRPVRKERGSSREIVAAWPGMVAAKVVSELVLTGKQPSPIFHVLQSPAAVQARQAFFSGGRRQLTMKEAMADRMQQLQSCRQLTSAARSLLGDTKVDLSGISKIIAERVAPKLRAN